MARGRALVRADGASFIGLGHVMRSLSLARELRSRGWEVRFATKAHEPESPERIRAAGLEVDLIEPEASGEADLAHTLRSAEGFGANTIVTDGYAFDTAFLRGLREAGLLVASIDDLAAFHFPSDIVINQNIHSPDLPYDTAPYTRKLLGPRYAMLRPEFRALRPAALSRPTADPPEILIAFGATDLSRQTEKALTAVGLLRQPVQTTVLVGAACPHVEEIKAAARRLECPVEILLDPPQVERVLAGADLAVSAAGTTTWELCCLGRPMLLMAVADNQRGIAAGMGRAGAGVNLGWFEEVTAETVAAGLDRLLSDSQARQGMADRAAKLVDGLGATRVAAAIEEGPTDRKAA